MSANEMISTDVPKERAFLVAAEIRDAERLMDTGDSLEELALLADTAGLEVVGETSQKLDRPNVTTYVGSGKVEEIAALAEETLADVVIFDDELTPRHLRELSKRFGQNVRVLDRTALILDIFAQHAHTKAGRLQVELAQQEYRLPRLSHAWGHLGRQTGGASGRSGSVGGVGLRGPGETQLEVDKREIRKRITILKREIASLSDHRKRYREQRKRSRIPVVALVGYTNAGKSTLLNRLSKSDVYAADQLFATLDPTTRRVVLPGDRVCLITDTVGFIQKLPTDLVAAFKSTLEEINEADLLLHVIDVSHYNANAQFESVRNTLKEIGADNIPTVNVFNKADLFDGDIEETRNMLSETDPDACLISAKTGEGIEELRNMIVEALFEKMVPVRVRLPYAEGALIALFHDQGVVDYSENEQSGVLMEGTVPARFLTTYQPFFVNENPEADDGE
ncbi:MAG: GTPase HflX [Anaerolineaceae bacterium]|nr:GTPase HflX [Anaerolineaceae bacterium]